MVTEIIEFIFCLFCSIIGLFTYYNNLINITYVSTFLIILIDLIQGKDDNYQSFGGTLIISLLIAFGSIFAKTNFISSFCWAICALEIINSIIVAIIFLKNRKK